MKLGSGMFILYMLTVVVPAGIAAVMARALWLHRDINGASSRVSAVALLAAAICVQGISILVAGGFGFSTRPVPTIGYTWAFWIGRAVLAAAVLNLARTVFGKKT